MTGLKVVTHELAFVMIRYYVSKEISRPFPAGAIATCAGKLSYHCTYQCGVCAIFKIQRKQTKQSTNLYKTG
jgi:hypothetical protein